jgi:glucose/arabinose dehydrogenase
MAAGVAVCVVSAACSGGDPAAIGSSSQTPAATRSATGTPSPSPSATPSGTPAPTPSPSLPPVPTIDVERVAKVPMALGMAVRRGDPALYVVSRNGRIWALRGDHVDPTPVLDISGEVSLGGELGLLGLTFSPDGRFAYINYTDHHRDTNIVEYAWRDGRMDPSTRRPVLFVKQRFPNHKGGDLAFGPDGFLYIGLGDGGSDYTFGDQQGDPFRNGQNVDVLLGKMLRIEPRLPDGSLPPGGRPYLVPRSNPFVGQRGARPEIWAYGLRNPWRWSFDRQTGDLWIGDVGAGAREEIDMQQAGSPGGQNYGWNALEGSVEWRTPPANAVPPVYEYAHNGGTCAVVGGFVYRGAAIPSLGGWFVFGDYCAGTIQGLRLVDGQPDQGRLGPRLSGLASFGQDQHGELYALSLNGGVYRLTP